MEVRYRRIHERDESANTYYFRVRQGLLPPPVKLGSRSSVLPIHEDELCAAAVLAGMSDDKRRELVRELVAIRPEFFAGRGEEALARVRSRFAQDIGSEKVS